MAEDVARLWEEYTNTRSVESRNDLVVHYASLVRYVASRVAAGLPSTMEREDLVAYGNFGLIDAIERFDPNKGVKFETYAVTRIRGSIIDELRAIDWVPRSIRSKSRDVDRATSELEAILGRVPTGDEVSTALGIATFELWAIQAHSASTSVVFLDEHEDSEDRPSLGNSVFDANANPEDLFVADEVVDIVVEAVMSMNERSKLILALYYLEELTLADIGSVLGVTQSRVCQLQSQMLYSIRQSLGHGRVA